MTTETATGKTNIVTQNETAIKNEIKAIENSIGNFQPILSAIKKAGFKPSADKFKELIYAKAVKGDVGKALETYMKIETIKATPAINDMPIVHEMKMAMIALPAICNEALTEYAKLRTDRATLAHIYSLEISKDGTLFVPDSVKENITNKHTVYGDDTTMKAIALAEEVIEKLKQLDKMTGGLSLVHRLVTQNAMTHEYYVNRAGINSEALQKMRNNKKSVAEPTFQEVINGTN